MMDSLFLICCHVDSQIDKGIRRIKDIFHEIERYSILVFRVFSDLFVL